MGKSKSTFFGKKENKENQEMESEQMHSEEPIMTEDTENLTGSDAEQTVNEAETQPQSSQNSQEELQQQLDESKDKYIRLMAEFDNFRKRSLKERTELIKSAGEDILINILPVIDDFERGLAATKNSTDIEAVKQGVELIYNKFKEFIGQRGIKEIESLKQDFNVDLHEALTKIPAPEEDLKGKVVDVIQKGYYLNEKVIRYAKVVVGE